MVSGWDGFASDAKTESFRFFFLPLNGAVGSSLLWERRLSGHSFGDTLRLKISPYRKTRFHSRHSTIHQTNGEMYKFFLKFELWSAEPYKYLYGIFIVQRLHKIRDTAPSNPR